MDPITIAVYNHHRALLQALIEENKRLRMRKIMHDCLDNPALLNQLSREQLLRLLPVIHSSIEEVEKRQQELMAASKTKEEEDPSPSSSSVVADDHHDEK
ncbi:unnamed protein product [Cuscuta epithymum]|uniref:Uncharacterized protein n=1 Tax=Cuscuta epithymum TaxID=186058 RepID=A0AAV0FMD2_9ASTE|nr:unnamed protein product [Cuscuta epithymum]